MTRGSHRFSRTFAVLAVISAIWALAVSVTGGVALDAGVFHLSSRTPRNPSIFSALSAAIAWILAAPQQRRRWVSRAADAARLTASLILRTNDLPRPTAPIVAAVAAGAILFVGLAKGTHVAGGADSYGYVSQADLWAQGSLRAEQPLMDRLSSVFARSALAPLGYRPAMNGPAIVPVYGAGLPIVMAGFERAAGRPAVFYVVPVMGALAVWATYVMGRRLAGAAVGAIAAVLLATSPVFLYQLMQPMSDVPVTAWWALTLAWLLIERPSASLAAGFCAGLAILTRANLALLLAPVFGWFLLGAFSDPVLRKSAITRLMVFTAGALPGCLLVVALNQYWYGSPLDNGYGRFSYLYEWGNLWPNLWRYPRWMLEAQTPLVLLAAAAPFMMSARASDGRNGFTPRAVAIMWLSFAAVVFVSYAFYAPFDVWWYLRFLLPAFPPLCVLVAAAIAAISTRFAGRARVLVSVTVVAASAWHGVAYARNRSAFDLRDGERKYVAVGEYIATHLPERAIFLSIQHSGSARYYSGRLTIRYDRVGGEGLDAAVTELTQLGYVPYFLLDADEEPDFRARFAQHSSLGALDWVPLARLRQDRGPRIYDPAERLASEGHRRTTSDIVDESVSGPRGLRASP